MKKILYYAAMVLAASAVMVSCEKDGPNDNGNDDGNNPGGDDNTPVAEKLATPVVKAEVGETEVTVSWEAIANAASYSYTVDAGAATTTTQTTFTLSVADLSAGNHSVSVRALPEEGSEEWLESDAGSASFTIQNGDTPEPGDVPEKYLPWIGTWTITTTQSMQWGKDPNNPQYVVPLYSDDPLTFDVVIEYDDYNQLLIMTGWSPTEAVFGQTMPVVLDVDENGALGLYNGVSVGTMEDGKQLIWLAMDTEGSFISTQQFAAYYCELNGEQAEGKPVTVEVTNTETGEVLKVTVNALELYGLASGGEVSVYAQEPAPAGSFTMTKSASGTSVNAAPFKAAQVYNAAEAFVAAGNFMTLR